MSLFASLHGNNKKMCHRPPSKFGKKNGISIKAEYRVHFIFRKRIYGRFRSACRTNQRVMRNVPRPLDFLAHGQLRRAEKPSRGSRADADGRMCGRVGAVKPRGPCKITSAGPTQTLVRVRASSRVPIQFGLSLAQGVWRPGGQLEVKWGCHCAPCPNRTPSPSWKG